MNFSRLAAAGVAAIVLGGALPAVAGATDYCVYPSMSCGLNNEKTFEAAIDAAAQAPDADRIFLGADTYTAQLATGFEYAYHTGPVEIIGQGRGQTILTSPSAGHQWVMRLDAGSGSSIHDLTIRLPENAGSGLNGLLTKNTASRIEVVEAETQVNTRTGVLLAEGGILADSTVTLGSGHDSIGVWFVGSNLMTGVNALRRSEVTAGTGVYSMSGGTIERARVTGNNRGVRAEGGITTIGSSLIRLTGTFGAAIRANTPGVDTQVTVDGVTIAVPSLPDTGGVGVSTSLDPTKKVHLSLTNSIIRGAGTPVFAAAGGGGGSATVSASFSDYESNLGVALGSGAHINETRVTNVGDAGFVDAAGGDYRLRRDSRLVETGDPDTAQGIDLDGHLLVADGDGDGFARRDLGAFELQPPPADQPPPAAPAADTQAPRITGFRSTRSVFAIARAATPRAARVARGTRLSYTLTENARVVLKIQRTLAGRPARYRSVGTLSRNGSAGANRTRFTGRIGRRALRPGRYRAVITATDTAGNRSARAFARFRVVRP